MNKSPCAAPAFGCARCSGEDAAAAWGATQSKRGPTLVQESHFSIRLTECSCGQAFVVVFTERIDSVTMNDIYVDLHVVGVGEVDANDKIASWRDYYDSREIAVKIAAGSGATDT